MFEQAIHFIGNHWILSLSWLLVFSLLILNESRRGGKALSPAQVTHLINKEEATIIDIRAKDEFKLGHIPNSINISASNIETKLPTLKISKDTPIVVICKTGTTAGATGALLTKAGYLNVNKLRGGIMEWQNNSLPLIKG